MGRCLSFPGLWCSVPPHRDGTSTVRLDPPWLAFPFSNAECRGHKDDEPFIPRCPTHRTTPTLSPSEGAPSGVSYVFVGRHGIETVSGASRLLLNPSGPSSKMTLFSFATQATERVPGASIEEPRVWVINLAAYLRCRPMGGC